MAETISNNGSTSATKLRLIATEEAFATPEFVEAYLKLPNVDTSMELVWTARFFRNERAVRGLTDIDLRVADMDAHGVDVHVLSLTAPGVQVFDPATGTALARQVNDTLAGYIKRYPMRFAGLAAIAPQDPQAAAKEVRRSTQDLGLNGLIINSHTGGQFLDDPKFWPIFEAAIKYDSAIYLHPTSPPESIMEPFLKYGMYGAMWGFGAECSLHAVRLILSGVFDEFPELQIVLGHMGEALPYWLFRLDNLYSNFINLKPPVEGMVKLKRLPSEYFKNNFVITTSGVFSDTVLDYALKELGPERIMFAIDYPYIQSKGGVDFIRNVELPADVKSKIAHLNAERIFRIRT